MDGYCEVNGWCPAERDVKAHHLFNFIEGVQNFSLFVRVTINFFEDNLIKYVQCLFFFWLFFIPWGWRRLT
jgi:hypothetical protein